MSDCAGIRDDLKAYVDGELSLPRRIVVRVHLARCAGCRKELLALVRIADELKTRDDGELGAALRYRILADAVEATAEATRQSVRTTPRKVPMSPAWSAAALALIVLACYPMLNRSLESALSRGASAPSPTLGPSPAGAPLGGTGKAVKPGGRGATAQPSRESFSDLRSPAAPPQATAPLPRPQLSSTSEISKGSPSATGSPRYLAPGDVGVALHETEAATRPEAARGYADADRSSAARGPAGPGTGVSHAPTLMRSQMGGFGGSRDSGAVLAERPRVATDVMSNSMPSVYSVSPQNLNIVRSAQLVLDVDQVVAKSAAVADIVRTVNGAVDNQLISNVAGSPQSAVIELRVPADRAEEVLRDIRKLGTTTASAPPVSLDYSYQTGAYRAGGGRFGPTTNGDSAYYAAQGGQALQGDGYGGGMGGGQAGGQAGGVDALQGQQRPEAQNRIESRAWERSQAAAGHFMGREAKDKTARAKTPAYSQGTQAVGKRASAGQQSDRTRSAADKADLARRRAQGPAKGHPAAEGVSAGEATRSIGTVPAGQAQAQPPVQSGDARKRSVALGMPMPAMPAQKAGVAPLKQQVAPQMAIVVRLRQRAVPAQAATTAPPAKR